MSTISVNGRYVRAEADVSKEVAFVSGTVGNTKQATVPAGESWELLGAVATITTSATVGNRTFRLRVRDGSNTFYQTAVSANLAASQTNAVREFMIGGSPALAANMFAPAGAVVDVFDAAAIDASTDTISIKLLVRKHYEAN